MNYHNNQFRVRKILISKKQEVFGITLPKQIGIQFENVTMNISVLGNQIILTSGLNIQELKEEAEKKEIEIFL